MRSGGSDEAHCEPRLRPMRFLSGLFRRKRDEDAQSRVSVRDVVLAPSPPTPPRHRDIDADMQALRVSRHDNPFLRQVLASRESLVDSLEESESDDATLMSQELIGEVDPLSLPEVHEHMIRSPPPTSWPRTANFNMFTFDSNNAASQDSLLRSKSPVQRCLSPRSEYKQDYSIQDDRSSKSSGLILSPKLSLPQRSYQKSFTDIRERNFTLATPAPLRSLTDVRRLRSSEDSQYLMPSDCQYLVPSDSQYLVPSDSS